MNNLLACSGDWTVTNGTVSCSGVIEQIAYSTPTQITYAGLVEAYAHGFALCVPVMAVIFGGKILLSMLR